MFAEPLVRRIWATGPRPEPRTRGPFKRLVAAPQVPEPVFMTIAHPLPDRVVR